MRVRIASGYSHLCHSSLLIKRLSRSSTDVLHLALASFRRYDFLVTWNCRYLANTNKFDHIRRVNGLIGSLSRLS